MILLALMLLSLALALTMSAVAWRVVRDDRRRSEARVALLAADIHGLSEEGPALDVHPVGVTAANPAEAGSHALFATPSNSPRGLGTQAIAVGAAAVILLLVGFTTYQVTSPARPANPAARQAPRPDAPAAPLELLSLDHERTDDHLVVHGVIRNPPRGAEVDHLTAVVLLFNQQGGFLTSGRSGVDASTLEPGANGTFTITIPGAASVGRYRVSFRTDDRVVPHVDKRES